MSDRLTPRALAQFVGGELLGEGDVILVRPAPFEHAAREELTFFDGSNTDKLKASGAGCIVTNLRPEKYKALSLIIVKDVRLAWAKALTWFPTPPEEKSPQLSYVSVSASVDQSSILLPFTYVGPDVKVGPGSLIGPNVAIHQGSRIGARVKIGAGSVIGSQGFGYATDTEGGHSHIPHMGKVVIEDDVEMGAGVCIDRGALGDTVIGAGTKIDNLVHIAHNVKIGRRCLIAGQSGIAGSSVLEDDVKLAGQVGIKDHVRIGRGAVVLAKSAVFKDIEPGAVVSGVPARPHRLTMRAQARLLRDAESKNT